MSVEFTCNAGKNKQHEHERLLVARAVGLKSVQLSVLDVGGAICRVVPMDASARYLLVVLLNQGHDLWGLVPLDHLPRISRILNTIHGHSGVEHDLT